MVCRVSAAMIGATRTVCAITMACGVNSRPHEPSGPERDSVRKTASPTTTGGRPISALSTTMTASRPRKRVSAISAPNGTPISAANSTALRLTSSDSRTMANRPGSPVSTKLQRGYVTRHVGPKMPPAPASRGYHSEGATSPVILRVNYLEWSIYVNKT